MSLGNVRKRVHKLLCQHQTCLYFKPNDLVWYLCHCADVWMWIRHVIINKGFHRHHSLFIPKNGYRMQINGIPPRQLNWHWTGSMNEFMISTNKFEANVINEKKHTVRISFSGKVSLFPAAVFVSSSQLANLRWSLIKKHSVWWLRWQINKIENITVHKVLAFLWTLFSCFAFHVWRKNCFCV